MSFSSFCRVSTITSKELKEIKGLNITQQLHKFTECLGETDKHGYYISNAIFQGAPPLLHIIHIMFKYVNYLTLAISTIMKLSRNT